MFIYVQRLLINKSIVVGETWEVKLLLCRASSFVDKARRKLGWWNALHLWFQPTTVCDPDQLRIHPSWNQLNHGANKLKINPKASWVFWKKSQTLGAFINAHHKITCRVRGICPLYSLEAGHFHLTVVLKSRQNRRQFSNYNLIYTFYAERSPGSH